MNPVTMYTSGWCPYCNAAERLLKARGVESVTKIRVDSSDDAYEQMLARTQGRRSVPQIFIGAVHVGGFDDLAALDRNGALVPLLQGMSPAAQP